MSPTTVRRAMTTSPELEERWSLFLRHRNMLADYLRCLVRGDVEAEDLFQELGLSVMRHPTGPDNPAHFAAWCRGVARNLAMHHWRDQRRSRLLFDERILDLIDRAYDEEDADHELWQERRRALGHCLDSLPAVDRELLRRRYADGAASDAIGQQTQRSADAVRMKLKRLRQALSRCIERRLKREAA